MDIDSLLQPVSATSNCGDYLCYYHVYDQLKELRREDDARLSQGIWQIEPKRANWKEVIQLSCELLKTRSKDLQIAMWLTEALTVEKGFEGFNEGLKLIHSLCEKFWDEIYPSIDWENHSYSYRIAPFLFLADKISERIFLIPLTNPNDSIVYSLSDWIAARRNLQIKNYKGISLKTIEKQVATTPLQVFEKNLREVNEAIANINAIKSFLDEKCSEESLSFKSLMDSLEDIKRITGKVVDVRTQQQIKLAKLENTNISSNEIPSESNSEDSTQKKGPTLNQAYSALNEIAAFLEEKQPQSPASTLVKLACQIGKKSFQELLELNMQSGVSVLNTISELYRIFHKKSDKLGNSELE